MIFKRFIVVLLLTFSSINLAISEEVKTNEHQINFFTGNFDFSDDKQKAILVGFQHQNENLYRDTLIGNVSPSQVDLSQRIQRLMFILE